MSGRRKTDIMSGVGQVVVTSKFVANNTVEWTDVNGVRYIRLHDTNILAFLPDGWVRFNTNGWQTPTTKDRMNNFGPPGVQIYQCRRVWYVRNGFDGPECVYQDGMMWHPDLGFRRIGQKPDKELLKKIRAYTKLVVEAMPLDRPGPGDCFSCQGILSDDNGHLMSHVEEGYVVPSMVARVLKEKGAGSMWWYMVFKGENDVLRRDDQKHASDMHERVGKWVYDYLYNRIVLRRKVA